MKKLIFKVGWAFMLEIKSFFLFRKQQLHQMV